MKMPVVNSVWVIDDDRSIRWVLEKAFEKAGMDVTCFPSADGVLEVLLHKQPDVVVSDVRMPGMDGLSLLQRINESYPELPVIIMTAHSDLDSAVAAFHSGAFEYLPSPSMSMRRWSRYSVPAARVVPVLRMLRVRCLSRQKSSVKRRRCRRCFAPSGGWHALISLC